MKIVDVMLIDTEFSFPVFLFVPSPLFNCYSYDSRQVQLFLLQFSCIQELSSAPAVNHPNNKQEIVENY